MEENTRLSDLTRMLLSSPSFSGFLDNLSTNPNPAPAQQQQQQQTPIKAEQSSRPMPKDVNPFAAQQQLQNQQINFMTLPEQVMDFSMLDLADGNFIYQPQVYSVLSLPEVTINTSLLAGKTSNFVGPSSFDSDDDKIEIPAIERPVAVKAEVVEEPTVDEEFEADPAFALFTDSPTTLIADNELSPIFTGISSDKSHPHFELVDATEDEALTSLAVARVHRCYSSLDAIAARLEALTIDL